jgi:predicted nucleic acid-binding protein
LSGVVLDNTVLSNFATVNRPELVMRLWPGQVYTTAAVVSEYRSGVRTRSLPALAWTDLPTVDLTEEEASFGDTLPPRLRPGERTCIAVAMHRDSGLATDDRDAREVAQRLGVRVTGTLGILVLAVEQHELTLDQANELLSRMVAAGYRSPVASLDALIEG